MVGFSVPDIIRSVDDEVSCINKISLHSSFKELGMVNSAEGAKVKLLIIGIDTEYFEFFELNSQIVFKLTLIG